MTTTAPVSRVEPSRLDFNELRTSLKSYLEASGLFEGYDFGGSALGSLLDVLAYNTHIQALTANFSLNEAFLDSAQLRSSVVSLAKSLNYVPRSRTPASATVDVSLTGFGATTGQIVLPKYTRFTASIEGRTFSFYTIDEYVSDDTLDYVFSGVKLYEGKLITKRFVIDARGSEYPLYVVPDESLWLDSVTAIRRSGLGSTEIEPLRRPLTVTDFGPDEEIYMIAESASGQYEITLGDGIVGSEPPVGTILEISYLATQGDAANGSRSFQLVGQIGGFNGAVATTAVAIGGSAKESLASIKFNAPRNYAAQDRAITVDDYTALLQNALGYVEAINVWGGESNVPPEYGAVFLAIKPVDAETLTQDRKDFITDQVLAGRQAIGIRTLFADPEYQYIELRATVRYRPTKTALTKQQLENLVKDRILAYAAENLTDFASTFRRSALTTFIDSVDSSITASDLRVYLQRRLSPTIGVLARYDLKFNAAIAAPSLTESVIVSDTFQYEVEGVEYDVRLRNKPGSYDLEIYRTTGSGDVIVQDGAGSWNPSTKVLTLLPFGPSGVPSGDGIRFSLTPADENVVKPAQNRLIRVDSLYTNVSAVDDE